MPKIDFDALNARLLPQLLYILQEHSPGGKVRGKEYWASSIDGGGGESFKVNVETGKGSDFSVDGSGFVGVIGYWAKRFGLSYADAGKDLAEKYGVESVPADPAPRKRKAETHAAPPANAPVPECRHHEHGLPVAVFPYNSQTGRPMSYVARYQKADGSKDIRPYRWSDEKKDWIPGAVTEPRPLFGLDRLADAPFDRPILLTEGEGKCIDAQRLCGDLYVCMTWQGGAQAWKKSDFTILHGRKILLWPDADKPGIEAMRHISDHLGPHCLEVKIICVSPDGNGWDASDALREGWDWKRIRTWALSIGMTRWKSTPVPALNDPNLPATEPMVIPPPADDEPDPYFFPFTDAGNVERLWCWFKDEVIYTKGRGWWLWNGKIWVNDAECKIRLLTTDKFDQMRRLAEVKRKDSPAGTVEADQADKAIKFFSQCGNLARVRNVIELSIARFQRDDRDFDADDHLFNCENGTVDLRTATLREHRRTDLITKSTGYAIATEGDCPNFKKLLFDAMGGSDALAKFLYTILGSSLSGCTKDQVLLLNHGQGSNGKSTLYEEVMLPVMGEYGRAINVNSFLATPGHQSSGPRPDLMALAGVRFGTMSEPPGGATLDDSLVKSVTGGDFITTRDLHKGMTTFRSQIHLFMSYNLEPRLKDFTQGMVRRLKKLSWDVSFAKNEDFKDSLRSEVPRIAWFLVQCCREWYERGLQVPEEVEVSTRDYFEDQNTVMQFRTACLQKIEGLSVSNSDMKSAYDKWADDNGVDEITSALLSRKLKDLGFKQYVARGTRWWKGVCLNINGENQERKMFPVENHAPNYHDREPGEEG